MNTQITNITIKDIPQPIKKIIEWDEGDNHFMIVTTNNILIPYKKNDELFYDTNAFGDMHKVIGSIRNKVTKKLVRAEGPLREAKEVISKWDEDVETVKGLLLAQFNNI